MERIYLSPPDVGPLEREYLLRALDSGWIAPVGPDLDAFEREISEFVGWPGAVAVSSGTAALHLALLVSGVQPGDDVMVSTFTFVASANAVVYCGANPVFIDSEASTWNMSPQLLADALADARRRNRLPKAVVVVDLYGQCADYDEIVPQCHELGITVIEDAAEAVGSTYKERPAGTLGDIGVFSFNGNKIITTSGGGMVVAPDTTTADRVRYLATQAREPAGHYEHIEVGYNYRLSNLLAAVGRAQLERIPEIMERRLEINEYYRKQLADQPAVTFMPIAPWEGWNGWLSCLVVEDSEQHNAVQTSLASHDIESRALWKPLHRQTAFKGSSIYVSGVSDNLFDRGACLPSSSSLKDEHLAFVTEVVLSSLR